MTEGTYIPQDAQSANSVTESWSRNAERLDRLNDETADREIEQQKVEVQKQEVQIQQQQQGTQQLLVMGGLGIGAALVLVLAIYLFAKTTKSKKR